ncbi:uncharacterized protein [Temnothorax longispinosus]|uniref:uncharacterized protein isoform X2 n=1 Tax=Temnothorax longispinosus TaxID=300112 RepID=UPI003A9A50F8
MSFYDNRYYHFNKILLYIIGQWPFQSRLQSNIMLVIMVLLVSTLTALEFWGLLAGITDLSIILDNVPPLLMNSFFAIKLINCLCNKYKMKELLEHIEKTWKIMHVRPENKILRFYAEESRTFTIRYMAGMYTAWFLYCGIPMVISQINLLLPANKTYSVRFLYRMEHVLDMDKYNNLLMLHSFFTVFYIISVLVATDCLFILCTQHACALFKCVKYNVERVQGSDLMLLNPNITDDEAYHALINCIKLYKRALNYSCDWYRISLRSRHLLKFTLMRTTKPCQIEPGKLFIMSMENFSSILKVSVSYFTVLISLQ